MREAGVCHTEADSEARLEAHPDPDPDAHPAADGGIRESVGLQLHPGQDHHEPACQFLLLLTSTASRASGRARTATSSSAAT